MLITIHGHFYQPPRENPWTDDVPRQESAAPFHDWNERISDECYGPNGRSRVLDPQGRIEAIVNNFAHLSFDFGPTLLSDLETRFPQVYRRILEADRESVIRHGGRGSAMAHAYNHPILPLANFRDKWTQVRWGLRDFEHRFGRKSEGFWLPETACDAETLQVVAEAGIRFLILAPHQALRHRRIGERGWREVSGSSPIDTSRPYRCFVTEGRQKRRWVDVFFYDSALSVGVSFEHLLRSAQSFADRLELSGRNMGQGGLVHLATDGEVYGHHEPFADMCLAFLFHREAARRGFRFVNYPEMLDLHPPEHEVQLDFTDTGEGTAWSCVHGVGRWSRDCGCSTGGLEGWNQKWRAPLRRGLDALRDQIQGAFLAMASPHLRDAWAARDDYIEVLLHPEPDSREEFLARHLRAPVDAPTRQMIWSLLEANHQAMLMYTSCAWFFADISGLEVQQNLAYAARACELAQPFLSVPLEALLLRHLEQARSNLPEWRDGAFLYRELVLPRRVGPEHAAAQAAFEAAILGRPLERRVHRYAVRGSLDPSGPDPETSGQLQVSDEGVEQSWSWAFRVSSGSLGQREVHLEPAVNREASVAPFAATFRLRDFQREVREGIVRSALGQALEEEAHRIEEIYEEARTPMGLLRDLGLPVPEIHRNLGCHVLTERFRRLAEEVALDPSPLPAAWWERMEAAVLESRRLELKADEGPPAGALSGRINALLDQALESTDRRTALDLVAAAYETLARADELNLPFPRTGLEPRAFDLVRRFRDELRNTLPPEPAEGGDGLAGGLAALRSLAGHANLQLEKILQEAAEREGESPVLSAMGGVN